MTLSNILIERTLANQMTFRLIDCSKIMAGDRWVIRLHCSFTITISDSLWQTIGDFTNKETVQKMIGKKLTHEHMHERHFIADTEKNEIIQGIIQRIENDILPYTGSPGFAKALLEKQTKEARLQLVTGEQPSAPSAKEEDEPADFSHLFK